VFRLRPALAAREGVAEEHFDLRSVFVVQRGGAVGGVSALEGSIDPGLRLAGCDQALEVCLEAAGDRNLATGCLENAVDDSIESALAGLVVEVLDEVGSQQRGQVAAFFDSDGNDLPDLP